MVSWIIENWQLESAAIVVGIIIGLLAKQLILAIAALMDFKRISDSSRMEAEQIKKLHTEVYHRSTELRRQCEELAGDLWKIRAYHDIESKFNHLDREFHKLENEFGKLRRGEN